MSSSIHNIANQFTDYTDISVHIKGESLVILKSDSFSSVPVLDDPPTEIHIAATVHGNYDVRPLGGAEQRGVSEEQAVRYIKDNFV